MQRFILGLAAVAMAMPLAAVVPAGTAQAQSHRDRNHHARPHKRYAYREWRGNDGRMHCRKPDGTTGLVIGGVAGALVGRSIDTEGDRAAGTLLGAAAGALAGRAIERDGKRCR